MYVIGLTGNIATGKSAVTRLLHRLGAEVIDADQVVHSLLAPGTAVTEAVRRRFGPEVIGADGAVDRRRLGAIVFRDPAALRDLEEIVHPAVQQAIAGRLASLRQQPQPPRAVVIEAIKLLEGGLAPLCDAVWLVTAPREVQVERLVRTRGMSPAEAALRIDAQPPAEPKRAQADVVIENDGSYAELRRKVRRAWQAVPTA